MTPDRATIETLIRILAQAEGLPVEVCLRQCAAESSFRPEARSPRGALGLFQLMPGTAADLKVNPQVWTQNVYGGIRYLAKLREHFHGDLRRALAAYNWGPGNVTRAIHGYGEAWETPIPKETAAYLKRILEPDPAAPAPQV